MSLFGFIKKIGHVIEKKTTHIKTAKRKELEEIDRLYSELEQKDEQLKHAKSSAHKQELDGKSIVRFRIIGALIVYASYLAFQSLSLIYLIAAAFIFSMVMDAPITFFAKRMNRGLAIFLAYFIMIIIIGGLLFFVLPFLFHQIADIIRLSTDKIGTFRTTLANDGVASMVSRISWLPGSIKSYILDPNTINQIQTTLQENISELVSQGTNYASNIGSFAVKIVTGVFSTIAQIALVVSLSVFFTIEKDGVIDFISRLAGNRSTSTYIKLQRLYAKLGYRLKGQLIVCCYIALMVFVLLNLVGLFGIHIPNIGTLAIIAGMTNILPYIGPILGSVPALLVVAVSLGRPGVIAILCVYAVAQWTENNVLTPIVMNRTLGVSPLVVFLCMIIGGLVFGFIGVLFAVPISVVISVLAEREKTDMHKKD